MRIFFKKYEDLDENFELTCTEYDRKYELDESGDTSVSFEVKDRDVEKYGSERDINLARKSLEKNMRKLVFFSNGVSNMFALLDFYNVELVLEHSLMKEVVDSYTGELKHCVYYFQYKLVYEEKEERAKDIREISRMNRILPQVKYNFPNWARRADDGDPDTLPNVDDVLVGEPPFYLKYVSKFYVDKNCKIRRLYGGVGSIGDYHPMSAFAKGILEKEFAEESSLLESKHVKRVVNMYLEDNDYYKVTPSFYIVDTGLYPYAEIKFTFGVKNRFQ